jgi:hypothetical protein
MVLDIGHGCKKSGSDYYGIDTRKFIYTAAALGLLMAGNMEELHS